MGPKKGNSWLKSLGTGHHTRIKPATGISGVLTNLFRIMVQEMNVNSFKWNSFMEQYLQREITVAERRRREKEARNFDPSKPPMDHAELNRKDRTSIRGNLNKEFGRQTMTWKVFCKGLAFLQIRRFRISLIVEHRNGLCTEHSTPIISLDDGTLDDLIQEAQEYNEQHPPAQELNVVLPVTSTPVLMSTGFNPPSMPQQEDVFTVSNMSEVIPVGPNPVDALIAGAALPEGEK